MTPVRAPLLASLVLLALAGAPPARATLVAPDSAAFRSLEVAPASRYT